MATSLRRLPNEHWDNHRHQYAYQTCNVGQDRSMIFWDIWRDMPIFCEYIATKGVIVISVNSGISGSIVINVYNVEKFILLNLFHQNFDITVSFGITVWQIILVCEQRRFFEYNWLPWQRPLRNQKSKLKLTGPYTGLLMLKFWLWSVL